MASAPAFIPLSEYLNASYEPDCEYLDGALTARNVGKNKHSTTQGLLVGWLYANRAKHGCRILPEQRVQVSRSRVRLSDVCLVPSTDTDEVIQHPPLLWVEILSPDDVWSRVQAKLRDLRAFGVQNIWIIDPYEREAWLSKGGELVPAEDGMLRCSDPGIDIPLAEVMGS